MKTLWWGWLSLQWPVLSPLLSVVAADPAVLSLYFLPLSAPLFVPPLSPVQVSDRSLVWNTDLMETLELENLLINAAITMHSAEQRKVRRDSSLVACVRACMGACMRLGCTLLAGCS